MDIHGAARNIHVSGATVYPVRACHVPGVHRQASALNTYAVVYKAKLCIAGDIARFYGKAVGKNAKQIAGFHHTARHYKVQAGILAAGERHVRIRADEVDIVVVRCLQRIAPLQMDGGIFYAIAEVNCTGGAAGPTRVHLNITVLQRKGAAIAGRLPLPALRIQLVRQRGFRRDFQPFCPRRLGGRALGQRRCGQGAKHQGRGQQAAQKLFQVFHIRLLCTRCRPGACRR